MAPPDKFAMEGLKALKRAVDQALERKRLLGQYAVFWRDGRMVLEGPDALKEQDNPKPNKLNEEARPQIIDSPEEAA